MSPVFEATIAGWAVTLAVIGGLIAFDLWHSRRSPHLVGLREAAGWSLFYTAVAVLFGVAFGFIAGWQLGGQYFAGYIVERSLSIDNLFVFVIILGTFSVPAERQPSVLMIGIVGALALRAVFIALGAALLEAFAFTYVAFGLGLIFTAVQLFRHRDEDPSVEDNVVVAMARRHGLPPIVLALVAIATVDVMSRWIRSRPCSASPAMPTSCSWPTPSHCSVCEPCTSWCPDSSTGSCTCRPDWRRSSHSSA